MEIAITKFFRLKKSYIYYKRLENQIHLIKSMENEREIKEGDRQTDREPEGKGFSETGKRFLKL